MGGKRLTPKRHLTKKVKKLIDKISGKGGGAKDYGERKKRAGELHKLRL